MARLLLTLKIDPVPMNCKLFGRIFAKYQLFLKDFSQKFWNFLGVLLWSPFRVKGFNTLELLNNVTCQS